MRIAIVKLSALGDIVHAMVVLQFIKKYIPDIEIHWIIEERYIGLIKFNPHINQITVVNIQNAKKNKSLFMLYREFSKVRKLDYFDLVIDMQGLIKSAFISRLIPSTFTVGFDKSSIRERPASFFYNKKFKCDYDKNIIERNIALISFAMNIKISQNELNSKQPFLFPKQFLNSNYLSKSKKNVLIIPGASNKVKCYPISKLAKLASEIDAHIIVTWGSSEEKKLAQYIQKIAPKTKVTSSLLIDELISLVSQVDLVIGSDTGPTHMAWALNIPSIALFGPTPGYRNAYASKINKIIESKSKVNPLRIDKKDYSIKQIKVKEILLIAKKLLLIK
jgi:heptosyltransferase-1